MTPAALREYLKMLSAHDGQKRLAGRMGISAAYLSDVINAKRAPGEKVLDWLGMEKVVRYIRCETVRKEEK